MRTPATRILTTLALPALLLLPAQAAATGSAEAASAATHWHSDLAAARSAAREDDRLILVDLYADWCGWCKALERQVFETPKFKSHAEDRFTLLRVDTEDQAKGSEITRHYGAYTLPTTLVLDTELVAVARFKGFAPLDTFLESLETLIASHEELLAMYERFHDSSEPEILATLAQEMLDRRDGPRSAQLYGRLIALGGHSEAQLADLRRRHAAAQRLTRWAQGGERLAEGSTEDTTNDSP